MRSAAASGTRERAGEVRFDCLVGVVLRSPRLCLVSLVAGVRDLLPAFLAVLLAPPAPVAAGGVRVRLRDRTARLPPAVLDLDLDLGVGLGVGLRRLDFDLDGVVFFLAPFFLVPSDSSVVGVSVLAPSLLPSPPRLVGVLQLGVGTLSAAPTLRRFCFFWLPLRTPPPVLVPPWWLVLSRSATEPVRGRFTARRRPASACGVRDIAVSIVFGVVAGAVVVVAVVAVDRCPCTAALMC